MKKLSQVVNEAKAAGILNIQDDALGYISTGELQKYLVICDKFISEEAKDIVTWLITNPDYKQKFGGGENPLADFFQKGIPTNDTELKALYSNIGKLKKANRLLEIPVFQNKEQFEGIISKKISPDEVLLDLETEQGRAAVAKKFNNLVWKIARSYMGKSNLTLDELYSGGLEALVYAMNHYGKQSKRNNADNNTIKSVTFMAYASWIIRNGILENIKNFSHTVHIPVSAQNKERKETGRNTRSYSISGDEKVGSDNEGNAKSRFDTLSDTTFGGDGARALDSQDLENDLSRMYDMIKANFPKDDYDIWCHFYGVNGYEKMKGIDLEKKYHKRISYLLFKINRFLKEDPKASKLTKEIRELMTECRNYTEQLNTVSTVKLSENF